uniref:Uncharacterized protein n=1 Tax=Esox lucius TaxID=8010 RepID=A0AAY5K192_ESOLU
MSGICVSGHAGRQPPRQTCSLGLSALVFDVFSVPDNVVLPLKLGDHQEELILQGMLVLFVTAALLHRIRKINWQCLSFLRNSGEENTTYCLNC